MVALSGPADEAPTMNSWPTRCDSPIASNVRWAALRGLGAVDVGRGVDARLDVGLGRGLDGAGVVGGAVDDGVGVDGENGVTEPPDDEQAVTATSVVASTATATFIEPTMAAGPGRVWDRPGPAEASRGRSPGRSPGR
jgi:hypothetical protein